jgi:nucleotide-binding universal stress UspA family protein
MLNSVLLHLEGAAQAEAIIRLGISAAIPVKARVRGLTLVDTREMESALSCEAAVYAFAEQSRRAGTERQHDALHGILSQACLQAGLNFDVRRTSGDPLRVLPQEARFHDLLMTSVSRDSEEPGGLSPHDMITLLERGAQPLLAVHANQHAFNRVLLAYDGSEASGRAIRSFLSLGILPQAEHRLVAIDRDDSQSLASLREMADYCLARRPSLETGRISGRTRRVLLPYAEKWQADLIVLGVSRGNRLWQWLLGNAALDVWRKLSSALYITT